MKSLRTRTLATVPVVALALTLLAGCSTADEGGGIGADGCALPGNKSDSVRVSGDFGTDLSLDSSVEAKGFQRTVMQQGEGEAVADGLTFAGRINVFVGNNRELYVQEPTKHVLDSAQLAPWFYNTVKCSNEGDRVASVFPAVDLLGPGGGESMGIADDDTMVVVVDVRTVLSAGAGRAVGAEQPLPEGFPAVALDEYGVPAIAVTETFAPSGEVQNAVRIVGEGPVIEANQTVLAHYRSMVARTGTLIDDTWATGAAGEPLSFGLEQGLPGLGESLVGKTVGSQVVIMVPSAGGYQIEDQESRGMVPDDVLIYVVDILDAG